jgi:glycosyltransferase involved in cell wall biosynthesis
LRIAIDAHMVGTRETGNETYILNLLKGLAMVDQTNTYDIYTIDRALLPAELGKVENFQAVEVRPASSFLRIPFVMPFVAWRQSADLLHVTYNAPPWCPCPLVVTVHDISYDLFPDSFSPRDRLVLSTLVPFSLRRAARVITGSEHTKRDMVGRYGLPEEKVVVTYYAADHAFRPILDRQRIAAIKAKYGITTDFILFLGSLQPRKNLLRLIEAFTLLHEGGALAHKLVIAGPALWRESEVYDRVRKYGLEEDVVFTDYVPHEDMPLLYNAADLFVFPSLYEGFGLPPLEAMACGTPVVASNISSLPEVLGDAAILVDPYDVQQLARAMHDVLSSGDLRQEMAAKGLERARRFSWAETAHKTLEVYQEVCSSKQRKLGDLDQR